MKNKETQPDFIIESKRKVSFKSVSAKIWAKRYLIGPGAKLFMGTDNLPEFAIIELGHNDTAMEWLENVLKEPVFNFTVKKELT